MNQTFSEAKEEKNSQLPLFWKFAIAISATVLLFGSINLLYIRSQVYRTFEAQIEKHGVSIAMTIAESASEPILYDDLVGLDNIIGQTMRVNSDIEYVMILNQEEQILAHSFNDYIPRDLVGLNKPGDNNLVNVMIFRDIKDKHRTIRDIALPIHDSVGGVVRVGMKEAEFYSRIGRITSLFIGMVLFFLFLGILAAFILSYVITDPLKSISNRASGVGLDSLGKRELPDLPLDGRISVRMKNMFNFTDEIDTLDNTFNEMLQRLNKAYYDLMKAHESLSHSEKMASVGTLAAGLAHEINNPLAGIRNCIRRISDKPENIRQNAEYIKMMSDALERIELVVEGMLNFSRKQDLVFTETDINGLIRNSVGLARYQLEKSGIHLTGNFVEESLIVKASPNHLEQVFLNILLNSIDAITERKLTEPSLTGVIDISANLIVDEVFVQFIDNGTGVPQEKLASIFDPFFTMKKIKQGTGLGLSVSYNIIASHNGSITAGNLEGGGLMITVAIPAGVRE